MSEILFSKLETDMRFIAAIVISSMNSPGTMKTSSAIHSKRTEEVGLLNNSAICLYSRINLSPNPLVLKMYLLEFECSCTIFNIPQSRRKYGFHSIKLHLYRILGVFL
ncbi:MAG: hypothetical protein ACTHKP_11675, partial [Nitrososphaeraceae archaeon]